MRLATFIRVEMESILLAWEKFAKTLLHAKHMNQAELRAHAREMLLEIADDLDSHQSETEQAAKSKGLAPEDGEESWAEVRAEERHTSGFSVIETISEFRALRASVASLWSKAYPKISIQQREDLSRFHEAIDQAVAETLRQYAATTDMDTRLFGAILVASPDPIYVLDLEGRFIYANRASDNLFALAPEAIIGKSPSDLGFSFAWDFQRHLEKVIADQAIYRGKFAYTFASGQGERFEYLLAPVLDEQKNTEAAICIFRDITEQTLTEEKNWHCAHHDLLTGLPNRRLFLDRLEQEIKHAKRRSQHLALLFLDLDGFKKINDSHGHEAGDQVLTAVAQRLMECVRENDTVARLGGDEFTVILAGTEQRRDVERVAQKIAEALKQPFLIALEPVQISASIGISSYPHSASTPNTLLDAADQAMYTAKKAGANRVCFYAPSSKQPYI
ncbi:MAG: GGDEF domain-containing protein [Halomonas sp.]|nr:MAG: GGDEF domain-containing protein [Halomonas sp.]